MNFVVYTVHVLVLYLTFWYTRKYTLYVFFSRIMMLSVLKHTKAKVKFWFLKNYLSPSFKVLSFIYNTDTIEHRRSCCTQTIFTIH